MSVPANMQAIVLQELGRVELEELPVPPPGEDEVLVRTLASTICTSDLIDVHENPFGGPIPRTLGHEGMGEIVAMGPNVAGLCEGQTVAVHPVIPCRRCANCSRNLGHLCLDMGHLGLNRDGTFAEYFRVRADRVFPLSRPIDPSVASLFEPMAVCRQAIRRGRVAAGENVLIVGDGPFGILISRLAQREGARTIVVGRHDFRLGKSRAAVVINERRAVNPLRAVLEATAGRGVAAAVLCVSSPSAVALAVQVLRARGRLVVFSPIAGLTPTDLFSVSVRELEILGACNDEERFEDVAELLYDADVGASELVTHSVPLAKWRDAMHLAAQEKDLALKVAIEIGKGRP